MSMYPSLSLHDDRATTYPRAVATTTPTRPAVDTYRELARQLRVDSIRSSSAAGSGHPSSSLSAADLMAVDRKSTRLNSSHLVISYAVFCLKKKTQHPHHP